MSAIDQIVFRAPNGSSGTIVPAFSSIENNAEVEYWQRRLDPWLRVGNPLGRGYLDFGEQAALIRWHADVASRDEWRYAVVFIAPSAVLTAAYALELADLPADLPAISRGGRLPPAKRMQQGPGHAAIKARARSRKAVEMLIPLLARVLAGERSVTMPWTEPSLPEAVMWGLVSIMAMLGDTRPVSFLTYTSGSAGQRRRAFRFVPSRRGQPAA